MKPWYLPAIIVGAVFMVGLPLVAINLIDTESPSSTSIDSQPTSPPVVSGVNISVNPLVQAITPGEAVTITVTMDALDHPVSGIRFRLKYPTSLLTHPQVNIGEVFNKQINFSGVVVKDDYLEVAMARQPGTPVFDQGQATLATINFTTPKSAAGSAQLTFDKTQSEIFDLQTQNVLEDAFSGTVNFK